MIHHDCYINPIVSKKAVQTFLDAFEPEKNDLHTLQVYHQNRMVVRIAADPYRADDKREVYSLSKSLTSTAIGFLVDEGKLTVEDRIIDLFPDKLPEVVSENLAKMRLKHVLSMTTGHPVCSMNAMIHSDDPVRAFLAAEVEHEPGTFFCYDTGATCLLSCIAEKLTGMRLVDFLTWRLFLPLGIHEVSWNSVRNGSNEGGCGIHLSSDDIIKFGLFYANKGKWNGKQLLSEEWIKEATTPVSGLARNTDPNANPNYAYQFWCQGDGIYNADGAFGQLCVVIPRHETVVVLQSEQHAGLNQIGLIRELAEHLLDTDGTKNLVVPAFPPLGSDRKTAGFENVFYQLEKNPLGWTGIYFVYDSGTDAMHAVFSNGTLQQTIIAGSGYHAESTVFARKLKPKLVVPMSTPDVEPCRMMGSYTAEEGKLTFRLRFRNSPNRVHVEFAAVGDDLTIDFISIGLYDEDGKHLVGHRLI